MTVAGIAAAVIVIALIVIMLRLSRQHETEMEEARQERQAQARSGRGKSNGKVIRKHFIFGGLVQGVGFRYQARSAAQMLDVTGWVQNLDDGRVEMEVQGTPRDINKVIDKLHEGRWIKIDSMEAEIIPCVEGERSFRVRDYY